MGEGGLRRGTGFVSTLVTFPLEMMRTCRSLAGSQGGIPQLCRTILAQGGPKTFYRGLGPGLVEECITNGLGFWSYELGQTVFANVMERSPRPGERGLIGGLTSMLNMVVTLPLILVQRKLQVQGIFGQPVLYKGPVDCVRQVVAQQGVKGLYRGATGSVLKIAPSIGAMYALYALIIQQYGIGGVRAFPHGSLSEKDAEEATAQA